MIKMSENFVTDRRGRKVGVMLNMRTYRRLLEDVEELAAIRDYDEAKKSGNGKIPFEEAVHQIERGRRK